MPISWPAMSVITVPSRAGARPCGLMPTRLRAVPPESSACTRAAPMKPPSLRRRLPIDQTRSASTGEMALGQFMAIEAEARLEPERIARTQANGLHPLVLQQQRPQPHRIACGKRDLKPSSPV